MSQPKIWFAHPHVRVDPEVLGGSPYIDGSRVPVRRLWAWHQGGVTVETLLRRYPQLSPAKVLDGLAFAYDNQEQIEADLARERELLKPGMGGQGPSEQQRLFADEPGATPGSSRRRR